MMINWEKDSDNIHMGYVGGRLFFETAPGGRLLDYKDHHTYRCGTLNKAKIKAERLLVDWEGEARTGPPPPKAFRNCGCALCSIRKN